MMKLQMLKASIPTFSLLIGVATGVERSLSGKLLFCVLGIGAGVALASVRQVFSIDSEATTKSFKQTPLLWIIACNRNILHVGNPPGG